jgi:phosphohistidine phosphatase SixA
MIRHLLKTSLWTLLPAALLLVGCVAQGAPAEAPPASAPPAAAQATSAPPNIPATAAPTALPATPTPVPPTATPTVSPSPVPSPTPTIAPATATPVQATPLEGRALVDALQQGGFVIYFRHAATDQTQTDRDLSRCEAQRNLNEQGRADARAIGAAFQALHIPVGAVLSSGFCRTRDTAQLAFAKAEIVEDLTGFPDSQREQRTTALRRLLSAPPQPGTNTVLVAHGFNITAAANISIAEGEAAIFAPGVADGFALVARILPDEWAALVEQASR